MGFSAETLPPLDTEASYRALQSRDARFDGRLFVGVKTTGIYCRPVCPARTPKLQNVRFFPTAAGAHEAGFRPCLRCRPESAPQFAAWRGTSSTVSRAVSLISAGALEGEGDVSALAARLGIGERHLRRLFDEHLGASPLAVAQARRVLFAKQLVHETDMKFADIALAAGFGSIRRFNGAFLSLFGKPPSAIRRERQPLERTGITLRLPYAPPYDWNAMSAFFAARAIPGVELVEPRRYRRTISLEGKHGFLEVTPMEKGEHALSLTVHFPSVEQLPVIVSRVRRMFDLGADVVTINRHLSQDSRLAPLVRKRPGLRVPGAWDGFELAVRAVLGQQVTVSAARRLAGKIVEQWGTSFGGPEGLSRLFPSAQRLAGAELDGLGMPSARLRTLTTVAQAAKDDASLFEDGAEHDADEALARLQALPGIGDWTAQYIALRALRNPDAFPSSDVGLMRGLQVAERAGERPSAGTLLEASESWRPWRAYAAQHLWTLDATLDTKKKEEAK